MEILGEASSVCHDLSCCKKSKKEETVATQVFDQNDQEEHHCWICLQRGEPGRELKNHCECKCLRAHDDCLAHWQLRNAGNAAEQRCRLCGNALPDWKELSLQGRGIAKEVTLAVQVNGRVEHMKVKLGGQEKVAEFTDKLKKAFGLSDHTSLDIDFTVQNPFHPEESVTLNGLGTYQAAVHCGALLDKKSGKALNASPLSSSTVIQDEGNDDDDDIDSSEVEIDSSSDVQGQSMVAVTGVDRFARLQRQRQRRWQEEQDQIQWESRNVIEDILEGDEVQVEQRGPEQQQQASSSGLLNAFCCPLRRRKRRR